MISVVQNVYPCPHVRPLFVVCNNGVADLRKKCDRLHCQYIVKNYAKTLYPNDSQIISETTQVEWFWVSKKIENKQKFEFLFLKPVEKTKNLIFEGNFK